MATLKLVAHLQVKVRKSGAEVLNTVSNVQTILEAHPDWRGVIAFNEFAQRIELLDDPPWLESKPLPRAWTDVDTTRTRAWLQQHYAFEPTERDCNAAIASVAYERSHHPVRKWLEGLKWDGAPRVDRLFTDYFGAASPYDGEPQPTDYLANVAGVLVVSMCARVFEPGCKVDTVVVLEGKQGAYKSSTLRALASPDWFSDTSLDFGSKDAMAALRGKWLVELGELGAVRGARSVETMKAFITSQSDYFRPAYAVHAAEFPRHCVFVGTTNATQYLADQTGNRRFLPVRCGAVRREELTADRDQIFAEAVHRYQRGSQWWLDVGASRVAAEEQELRTEEDPWEAKVHEWLKCHGKRLKQTGFTILMVLEEALELPPAQINRAAEVRAGQIVRAYGWRPKGSSRPRKYRLEEG